MRCFGLLAAGCLALIAAPASLAQEGEATQASVNRIFVAGAPNLGEPLPDVTVYDDAGQPFPLRNLRGKHAVLVFGCLT